jgi:hypothetical protein
VEKILVLPFLIIGVIAFSAVIGLLMAFPIMWCWNYTVVTLFHLPVITWGQAWCLNFLASCFIKAASTGSSK